MLLREWLDSLNRLIENDPEVLNHVVIHASDDEGNDFRKVSYSPTAGFYDGEEFSKEESDESCKCVCLN